MNAPRPALPNGIRAPRHDVGGMSHPVKCRWCGHVHDGGKVTVIERYADCDVWKCPGCGTSIDNRPISWGGSAIPIDRRTGQETW